jgi:hypothetical protein
MHPISVSASGGLRERCGRFESTESRIFVDNRLGEVCRRSIARLRGKEMRYFQALSFSARYRLLLILLTVLLADLFYWQFAR